MPELFTDTLLPGVVLPPSIDHQIYCGLDNGVTSEVLPHQHQLLDASPEARAIYHFERELQGPYLDIMLRGFAVDEGARRQVAQDLREEIRMLQTMLNDLAFSVLDAPLNPRSADQLKHLFYNVMRLPEVIISKKGERKSSMDREALEKLSDYLYARPFISIILQIRALAKQLERFEEDVIDGRYFTSYNIAGTETGRPSSSTSVWGTGGNAMNVPPSLRWAFIADRGCKLGQIDLEQVEARDVGFFCGCLFDDWTYLDACESGDLHTSTARGVWKSLPWTGDRERDRRVADQIFYREFTYRDMAKRGSHLSNYMGTAWTASRALKVALAMMEDFQAAYCRGRPEGKRGPAIMPAYPAIPRWWQWTAQQLQTHGFLVTPFGRKRHFFGRHGDDTTLREAIAFLPQSTTADRMNIGLLRVWRKMPGVQLLGQCYDSIVFQFPDRGHQFESQIISDILKEIRVTLRSPGGRIYEVPGEAKIGWNWGHRVTQADQAEAQRRGLRIPRLNEEGLQKWSLSRSDERQRRTGLGRASGGYQ